MNGPTDTTDSDRQLAELDALDREDHPYFLAISLSDHEIEFLGDLRANRDRRGDLSSPSTSLTARQAGWLQAIHRKALQQCREADALARRDRRGAINMSRYHVGA